MAARLGLVKTARLVYALRLHLRHAATSLLPARAGAAGSTAVYVGGLQWWTTDAELDALCRPYGELISLRFFEDKGNGKSKGYALAKFATAEAALRCKEGLNGSATHRMIHAGPGTGAQVAEPSVRCRHNINGKKCVVTFAAPAAAPGAARVSTLLAPDRACPGACPGRVLRPERTAAQAGGTPGHGSGGAPAGGGASLGGQVCMPQACPCLPLMHGISTA